MKFSSFLLAAGAAAAPTLDKRQGLPAGVIYNSCTTPGVVALTFDDGPYAFTAEALDILDAAGFKATFFLNGANWASIYDYSSVVQRMYSSGYMVGSHTWSHADLATLDAAGIDSQMTQVETALLSIIGVRPLWVRLPYLSSIPATLTELGNLGYAIAGIDIDTKDYENTATPQVAIDNYVAGLNAGGTISLAHDVYQNTVENVLPGLIAAIQAKNLRSVTLAECLGLSLSSVYATSPRGSTTSTTKTTSTATSTTKTTSTTATTATTTTGTSTTKTTTTTTGTSTSTGTSATGTSTTKTTTTTATGTSATGTSTTTTATGTSTTGTSAGTSTTKTTTTTTATGTSTTTTGTNAGTSTTKTTTTTGTSTTATGTSTTSTTATGTSTTGTTATGTSTTKTTTTTGTSTTATGTSTTKTTTTTTGTSTTGTSTTKTSTSTAAATSTGYPVSTDWQCGASVGTRCPSGNCCSRYGWCGTTRDYCKSGCQSAFGICS